MSLVVWVGLYAFRFSESNTALRAQYSRLHRLFQRIATAGAKMARINEMKKIGILGGMSAASSQLYYRTLCELTLEKLGGLNSPDLLLRSLNFAPLAEYMNDGEWKKIGAILNREALLLQSAKAEILLLASNTMHKMAEEMMASVNLPLVHIADATADAVAAGGCSRPAFIATRFTMEERFYLDRLESRGLQPIVPNKAQREEINRIIFDELCRNEVTKSSQNIFVEIVNQLKKEETDSVVLGCTEVCLLINEQNAGVPVFDTTTVHCEAAIRQAI